MQVRLLPLIVMLAACGAGDDDDTPDAPEGFCAVAAACESGFVLEGCEAELQAERDEAVAKDCGNEHEAFEECRDDNLVCESGSILIEAGVCDDVIAALEECLDDEEPATALPRGVATIDGLTKLEAPAQLGNSFGPLVGGFLVAFAGAEGTVVVDLANGEAVHSGLFDTPFLGVLALETSGGAALFQHGVGQFASSLLNSDPKAGFEGFAQLISGTLFDASNTGSRASGIYAGPDRGVIEITPDAQGLFAPSAATELPASDFPGGSLYSAASVGSEAPVAAIVNTGADSDGLLLFHNRSGGPATEVGATGKDPRKIRCLSQTGLCAISNFAGDDVNVGGSLTIVLWDGTGTPTIVGNIPVGAGPVGVELFQSGDNTGILVTGFNDDTVSEVLCDASGTVVSSVTEAAPSGCTQPAHALRCQDVDGPCNLYTCYGSDNYAISNVLIE